MGSVSGEGMFTAHYPLPHGGVVLVSVIDCGIAMVRLALRYLPPPVYGLGVPVNAAVFFVGIQSVDPADVPVFLNPAEGAQQEVDAPAPELRWSAGESHRWFQLQVSGDYIETAIYLDAARCQPDPQGGRQQCRYRPDAAVWRTIAESARGAGVRWLLSGVAAPGLPVAKSAPLTLTFAP